MIWAFNLVNPILTIVILLIISCWAIILLHWLLFLRIWRALLWSLGIDLSLTICRTILIITRLKLVIWVFTLSLSRWIEIAVLILLLRRMTLLLGIELSVIVLMWTIIEVTGITLLIKWLLNRGDLCWNGELFCDWFGVRLLF